MACCSPARTALATAALAAAALGNAALAQTEPPDFRMIWDVSGDANGPSNYSWGDVNGQPGGFGELNGYGEWTVPGTEGVWTGWNYTGDLVGSFESGQTWELQWDCVFANDVDGVAGAGGSAFVVAHIVVTNNDINMNNFQSEMILPLDQAILSPLERGSIGGLLTDLTFDDALVAAPDGARIYTPRIDDVDEMPGVLMADPFQATAGLLESVPVGPAEFGIPNPIPATQDADDRISVFLNFDLSAGDAVEFTAIFEVLPIPAPSALGLLAAAGLLGRRRRRC